MMRKGHKNTAAHVNELWIALWRRNVRYSICGDAASMPHHREWIPWNIFLRKPINVRMNELLRFYGLSASLWPFSELNYLLYERRNAILTSIPHPASALMESYLKAVYCAQARCGFWEGRHTPWRQEVFLILSTNIRPIWRRDNGGGGQTPYLLGGSCYFGLCDIW